MNQLREFDLKSAGDSKHEVRRLESLDKRVKWPVSTGWWLERDSALSTSSAIASQCSSVKCHQCSWRCARSILCASKTSLDRLQ